MLLSVVIPVYNVVSTLDRCVRSVLAQHIDHMEVIIVDDGSTDGSSDKADKYSSVGNVKVVHQLNAGLSAARNVGIDISKGDFITFVDSDDFLSPNTFSELMCVLRTHPQYDIIEYSVIKEEQCGRKKIFLQDREYTDMRAYWIEGKGYSHAFAWNKIYRRNLFDQVRFEVGRRFEDVRAMSLLLNCARCIYTTSKGLYHYTYNPTGITSKAEGKAWRDLLDTHLNVIVDKRLRSYQGFEDYYYQVLNIQLHTYELTGEKTDIRLFRLSYYNRWKFVLLQLLGMRDLCRLDRLAHRFVEAISQSNKKHCCCASI